MLSFEYVCHQYRPSIPLPRFLYFSLSEGPRFITSLLRTGDRPKNLRLVQLFTPSAPETIAPRLPVREIQDSRLQTASCARVLNFSTSAGQISKVFISLSRTFYEDTIPQVETARYSDKKEYVVEKTAAAKFRRETPRSSVTRSAQTQLLNGIRRSRILSPFNEPPPNR